ncbi:MAG: NAD-dependent succinate-semialdehyde dehydrogenase [Desulfobacteraceae bacterium]|nr:NAD-dependent succinate-semialdehyde dehydrogenase [Desulfobacteraceae bacterium]
MKSINPATNELIKEYTPHNAAEAKSIVQAVDQDWQAWRKTSFAERAALMHKASDILLAERDECAGIITAEMGKLMGEARGEVEKCALACRFYADNAEKLLRDEVIETDFSKSFVTFEPIGVVLAVMPWNFPFWQVWRFIAPALMAGNAAVLKHASNVFGCAEKIEEVVRKAGFPENIFRSLLIPAREVEAVIANPLVKAVTLTGSEPAGSKVAETAGRELKKCVMELGGSDPFIVLEDADLDACVKSAVTSRTLNAGQVCIAAKRFIIVESVAAEFEALMKEQMEALVVGNPMDDNSQMAPMARQDLLDEIHDQVERSIAQGGKLVTGGKPLDMPGNFYAPTIISDVKKGNPVYEEETFGPVAALITVKDEAEAVAVANDTDFGLGGSVWTADEERGVKIARRIETGMVFVNNMVASSPQLPFGGVKRSGFGRELADYGIKEFMNIKTVCVR